MRNTKKILIFLLFFLTISSTYWYDIKNIENPNDKTINFTLDQQVELADQYNNSDLKVLEDLEVSSSVKNFNDPSKLTLSLKKDIIKNYSYSILSLFWVDWNMDFKVWNDINWVHITNSVSTWIKSINILDKNRIEIIFDKPLVWDEFEFKFLREIPIDKILRSPNWWISINLMEGLMWDTNYMIVVISLKDVLWILLNFDEWIYDFRTKFDLLKTSTWTLTTNNEKNLVNMLKKDNKSTSIKDKKITNQLTSTWKTIEPKKEKTQLEKVALNSAMTPDTWPETWILVLLTLILNTIISFRKKFIKV